MLNLFKHYSVYMLVPLVVNIILYNEFFHPIFLVEVVMIIAMMFMELFSDAFFINTNIT